jgi:2-iminobutanoate/2-iminopropanoate deaminase
MRLIPALTIFALGACTTLVTAAALQQPQQSDVQYIGNGLYLSGQLGLRGERGIQPETRGTMESIKSLLEANGSTMDDVVKCTVFLADFADFSAMNEVYASYFTKHRPARSTVAVAGMFGDAKVEIECMAVIGARNATSS